MGHESILRQVALVSHGTKFLRNELALEEWYRHGIFFGARLQFRQLADNALLADDFTLWLGILLGSGAVRLSLHALAEFDMSMSHAMRGGDYAVVAHFADHYQIWAVGEERAAWRESALLSGEATQRFPEFPDATGYGGDLDSYWSVTQVQGKLDVPDTDWRELAAAIAADLEVAIPSSQLPAGPYIVPMAGQPSWAQLPLFPSSKAASLAHALLATLCWEQAKFANDTHPKNEDSYYRHLDKEGAAQADAWGTRLDKWVIEVRLRCANEYRGSDALHGITPPAPVQTPARPAGNSHAAVRTGSDMRPKGKERTSHAGDLNTQPATLDGKWTHRIVLVVLIAVSSLMILSFANIIARFPWLSILIGLPCALYVKFKKE